MPRTADDAPAPETGIDPETLFDRPYPDALESHAPAPGKLTKGARTRLRLMAAAARVMEAAGFHRMRVSDVCDQAGVSQGTFYLYFRDKAEVASAVLVDFNERGLELLRRQGPRARAWDAIHESVRIMTRLYRLNPGLMRCLFQISDDTPEFGEILRRFNAVWLRSVAHSMARRCGLGDGAGAMPLFTSYALAAMVDQFLVQLYVTRDPHVVALVENEDHAAEALSALWYRAAYRADPPDGALSYSRALEDFELRRP